MVEEEIITSLKNAVDHGDSLENAMQLAINSGYTQSQVQEAAQFVSRGTVNFQPSPGEQLSMPAQKSMITGKPLTRPLIPQTNQMNNMNNQMNTKPNNLNNQMSNQTINMDNYHNQPNSFPQELTHPINNQITNIRQDNQAIKQNISDGSVFMNSSGYSSGPSLYKELNDIRPQSESYVKEIILIIILLILVGVLVSSFLFKEAILAFFSSLSA